MLKILNNTINILNQDPRILQIITLSLVYLISLNSISYTTPKSLFIVLCCSLLTQFIFSKLYSKNFDSRSTLITALSISIILRSSLLFPYLACALLAISSKFLISINKKHFFNPANFGIVLSIILFDTWISPASLNFQYFSIIVILCLASIILSRVKTYYVCSSFFITYFLMQYAWNIWLNKPIAVLVHDITQPTILIFTFFMISDPKTAPKSIINQLIFGIIVALLSFILKYLFYNSYGILYSLFIVASLNLFFYSAQQWRQKYAKHI